MLQMNTGSCARNTHEGNDFIRSLVREVNVNAATDNHWERELTNAVEGFIGLVSLKVVGQSRMEVWNINLLVCPPQQFATCNESNCWLYIQCLNYIGYNSEPPPPPFCFPLSLQPSPFSLSSSSFPFPLPTCLSFLFPLPILPSSLSPLLYSPSLLSVYRHLPLSNGPKERHDRFCFWYHSQFHYGRFMASCESVWLCWSGGLQIA